MKTLYKLIFLSLFITLNCLAQTYDVPEMMYYKFNESGTAPTPNLANPGVGYAQAVLMGSISMGAGGQFDNGLIGTGGNGGVDFVDTGWPPSLSGDWTISLYLNNLPSGTTLYYLFGETTTGGWRCFYGGAAGQYGVLYRVAAGGGTDITVPNVGPGPSVLTFVYNSAGNEIKAFINGVLTVTQPQAGAINISGTGFFKVGAYSTSAGMPPGSFLDEFRMYSRALSDTEVFDTWNHELPYTIPVELTSFVATVNNGDVVLQWETATELNNSGFKIERKTENTSFTEIGFVPGFGTTTEPKNYSFVDGSVQSGIYTYRLKQIDFDGTFEYSDEVNVEVGAPAYFSLEQNYPNPFNPSTKISFELAVDSKVTLTIYNLLGEKITQLTNGNLTAGTHEVDFNADNLQSGVYFYKLHAIGIDGSDFSSVKKMILTK